MKNSSNNPVRLTAGALAAVMVFGTLSGAEVEAIVPPQQRQQALEAAKELLATKQLPASYPNPFFSEAFNEAAASAVTGAPSRAVAGNEAAAETGKAKAAPTAPKAGRDLLQAIALSLKPSGYFVLGGAPTLVFGQKRVKAGGTLTINFEGSEYTLEVVALDRTNFTLRLNREEFTRPIK